jgi:hypothetical protein
MSCNSVNWAGYFNRFMAAWVYIVMFRGFAELSYTRASM